MPTNADLLRWPVLGRFLRWRHARTALQLPLLLLAVVMVIDGLVGPQLAPKNLATVLTWVHYRGWVILALLVAGNLLCMACPFVLVRNLARRLLGRHSPTRLWPRWLRHKGPALVLLAGMLFCYELFDLWASPLWTAWIVVAYFGAAVLVDSLFRGATFCKYVCPLGQFNFASSLASPLAVQVRSPSVCSACTTKDCIQPQAGVSERNRGCELWLFQPQKVGNMDCTFCLDCARACPHDNVGLRGRLPAEELATDPWRSGIGRFSRRPDLVVLSALFTFGALLNAFGMVSPVYAVLEWLAARLGNRSEAAALALLFLFGLGALPAALLGLAGWTSRQWAGAGSRPGGWISRYAFALVPLGFAVWLAHYGFHFLTGFWTVVPVVQSFVADLVGAPLLGTPRWGAGPLLPLAWLFPVELGFLGLGWMGALLTAYRISAVMAAQRRWQAFLPWAVLLTLLLAAAVWLMRQPMEMRGTWGVE